MRSPAATTETNVRACVLMSLVVVILGTAVFVVRGDYAELIILAAVVATCAAAFFIKPGEVKSDGT